MHSAEVEEVSKRGAWWWRSIVTARGTEDRRHCEVKRTYGLIGITSRHELKGVVGEADICLQI